MKKYWKEIVIVIFTMVFIIPMIIALMLSVSFICTDTTNEWIGFWGGYLGSILGGIITLYVLFQTLKNNEDIQKRNEKVSYCNYVIEKIAELNEALSLFLLHMNKYRTFKSGYCSGNKLPYELEESKRNFLLGEYNLCLELHARIEREYLVISAQLGGHFDDKSYKKIIELKKIINQIGELVLQINTWLDKDTLENMSDVEFDKWTNSLNITKAGFNDVLIDFIEENTKA